MRFALLSLCFVAFAGAAAAQTTTPSVLDQVYACANVTEEHARLACYDGAVGRLRQAQTSGEVVAVDRQQAQQINREAFGFSLPSLPHLFHAEDHGADSAAPAEIEFTLASVSHTGGGKAVFTMTNGQVWEQIDTERTTRTRAGGQVTVHRAALGSFLMSVAAGGHAIRVRRRE